MSTPAHGAPDAPGRLGEAIEPQLVQEYLSALGAWLRTRHDELEELDGHALASGRGEEVAGDTALALALWKAIQDRVQLISATFDGGRVLERDRERIAALIWGRMDGATLDLPGSAGGQGGLDGPGGPAVSLPEACRLHDALTGQLRTRLALEPGSARATARIRELRAQVVRLRDQAALEPDDLRAGAMQRVADLAARLQQVEVRAEEGADVGGLLGPLELDATTYERDLIVGHAQRRHDRDRVRAAQERTDDLLERAAALARLADRCLATVDPAPHYAVPDVGALGPVPRSGEEVETFRQQLDRVSEALDWAQERYAAALAEHEELTATLDALTALAREAGVDRHDDLVSAERAARSVLDWRPTPMLVARQLVAAYRAWVEHHGGEDGDRA